MVNVRLHQVSSLDRLTIEPSDLRPITAHKYSVTVQFKPNHSYTKNEELIMQTARFKKGHFSGLLAIQHFYFIGL